MTESEIVSLKIIPLLLTIEDVYFSSYKNPSAVNIVVDNPHAVSKTVTVKLYIDNYATSAPTAEITDIVPAMSKKTLTKAVNDLNLTSGKHFIHCSL